MNTPLVDELEYRLYSTSMKLHCIEESLLNHNFQRSNIKASHAQAIASVIRSSLEDIEKISKTFDDFLKDG